MSHSAALSRHIDGRDDGDGRNGRSGARRHSIPVLVLIALGLGVFAGLVGLLPWTATGMVLPLQNLWAEQTLPDDMPQTLLPLNQYMAIRLVALMVVGGLVAGLVVRWWSPVQRRTALWCAAAGLLLVQVTATVQSFSVLNEGLLPGSMSELYSKGLLAGVVAAEVAGVLVLLAAGARPPALVALGVGAAAVPAGEWIYAWAELLWPSFNMPLLVPQLLHWFPAVLVGLVLAWCTPDRAGRIAVWLVDLVLLWTVPALFTAVSSALGTRVFRGDLAQMQDHAQVSLAAGLAAFDAWGPVLLAAALGVAGVVLRRATVRRRA